MRIWSRFTAGMLAMVVAAIVTASGQTPAQSPPPQQPPPQQTPPAQTPPAQPAERAQQPPIRTGINYVRVDVIVSNKQGQPVLDLAQNDFAVTEDGKPQTIDSFSVVKIDEASQADAPPATEIRSAYDEEHEAARPDVRLFVILLDDYHVRRGNDMAVRKPLIDFIQNQLAPADMVAIMYPLTPVGDVHFSRNRDSLVSAIEKFEGRKFNYEPRNDFEQQYAYYPAAMVEKIRNDVSMGALKGAAVRLASLREGRKSIIFVSEGFTSTLPAQLNDPVAAMPGLGNPARGRTGADVSNPTSEFFNEASLMNDLRDVFDVANRQNTSIYPVDPRGLAVFEYGINEGVGQQVDRQRLNATMDTLRVIADNTDGRAIVNRNDLAAGMKQIIRDSSGYYLLGYNSTQAPTDGKFHEIKVKVTRRGVDVRARKGYWAFTAEDAARALAPKKAEAPSAVMNALNSIAEPTRGRPARFWIGTSRGAEGRTKVTFLWEPLPPVSGETRRDDSPPARVVLTVTAADGHPIYKGRVPDEAAATSSASASSTPSTAATDSNAAGPVAPAIASFEAAPGQVQLRMVVENSRGQVIDSTTRDVTLPDFSKVQVSLSTPRVYRARTARDAQSVRTNLDAVPTADRSFSRSERLIIRIDAYAPGGVKPAITARLLNRGGQSMADLPTQVNPAGSTDIELALASLGGGDYLIEVTAKTESGTAQELIPFKVGR